MSIDWAFAGLLLALAAVVLGLVGAVVALRSARRTLKRLERRMARMVDPCEDPIAIRLQCLEKRLARMAPGANRAPLRSRERARSLDGAGTYRRSAP